MGTYSVLDHTADTGIEASAGSLEELVEQLAIGMFELMADMGRRSSQRSIQFDVTAESNEDLIYEALSELLYHSEIEDVLFRDFTVEVIGERALRITAHGIPSEEVKSSGPPIKAVTYHGLVVTETRDGWNGRVYFDV